MRSALKYRAVSVNRVQQLVAQLEPRGKGLSATALKKLRLPDGAAVPAELAAWLAFDATSLGLLEGGRWALVGEHPVRACLKRVQLPADVPLIELSPAASHDRLLALAPARGNPVLAWDEAEVWVISECFADFLEVEFPPPRKAPGEPPKPVTAPTPKRLTAFPGNLDVRAPEELRVLAAALAAPSNAKWLKSPTELEALVRALGKAGLIPEALAVLALHAQAWSRRLSQGCFIALMELAAETKDRDACTFALDEYRAWAKRDPNSLYFLGALHAAALVCADVLGRRAELLTELERVFLFISAIPDSVPADEPVFAELWARPALQVLRAAQQTKTPKKKRS